MIANQVRDIFIPLRELPCLPQDATVRDAFTLLHRQHTSGGWRYRHILVFDGERRVVGLLSLVDLLLALMPDYIRATLAQHVADGTDTHSVGTSLSLLWQESFAARCRQMDEVTVAAHMRPVRHTVRGEDPITLAAYLMIAHQVHMLPVLEEEAVAGVVRIVDVFNQAATEVLGG